MELRSPKGCIDLHGTQVTILGRQHLLEHFDLQSTNISRWGSLPSATWNCGIEFRQMYPPNPRFHASTESSAWSLCLNAASAWSTKAQTLWELSKVLTGDSCW